MYRPARGSTGWRRPSALAIFTRIVLIQTRMISATTAAIYGTSQRLRRLMRPDRDRKTVDQQGELLSGAAFQPAMTNTADYKPAHLQFCQRPNCIRHV